jgi:cytochrome c oxidase subunit IV
MYGPTPKRNTAQENALNTNGQQHATRSYRGLAVELAIDFAIMYLVMYTMIATLDHFRLNLNNVYMTLMMVAPMAVVMLVAMRSMFPSRRANAVVIAAAVLVFIASFGAMRTQASVGNDEFLRSMIPHHSGAILMCREAAITDPEIVALCKQIIDSQQREIAQMTGILDRR